MTDPTLLRRAIETVGIEKPSDVSLVMERAREMAESTDMVERVARAILKARGIHMRALPEDAIWRACPKEEAFAEARAAIAAMKHPTKEMFDAFYHMEAYDMSHYSWNAMIDAALNPPSPPSENETLSPQPLPLKQSTNQE